ncbi:MAG TPA: alpha/beta hydrolase [Methylocella sp.]|nr:alpha/beta hydrolase [Methylocella sp.]
MHEFSSPRARLAYIDEPPTAEDCGEPILLIHGFASNHAVNWVFPQWVKSLTVAGRRVIAFDNRGHGRSEKFYDPADYSLPKMAQDACDLLDHLEIGSTDVMGYSMGGRIASFLALASGKRVRSLILGGIGVNLIERGSLPPHIAEAMEAPSLTELTDPLQRMFRSFAETTKSDLKALAACARGAREPMRATDVGQIAVPVLIAAGTKDEMADHPHRLALSFRAARVVDIPGRDHNHAVGDKVYKKAVLEFLSMRP